MIFLVLYAMPIWCLCFMLRRRAGGLVLLALGTIAVPLLIHVEASLIGPWAVLLRLVGMSYAALIAVVGLTLWWQRRAALAHECRGCRYDLRGNVTGVCPECGRVLPSVSAVEVRRAKRSAA